LRNWIIAAPFIYHSADIWLAKHIPSGRFDFYSVPAKYRHDRSRPTAGRHDWLDYFFHGNDAWRAAQECGRSTGIITCFPQLAVTTGLQKRVRFGTRPIVAWNFNLGSVRTGVRKQLARYALASIDRFVVHSKAEVSTYSEWLDFPRDRFRFVPLQRAIKDIQVGEDLTRPFVLSMGSANRDYRLLFDVLRELRYEAVVVAGQHALTGLSVPENVKVMSGLSLDKCHELVQRARVNVIPIANVATASGQVTFLDAMMFGRPVIATRCASSEDYIDDGVNGLLVPPNDPLAMRHALRSLWENQGQRHSLGVAARQTSVIRFSDIPVAQLMAELLAEFE
jgi:glycosyltransferase involved in cell wall biosynthesis